MAIHLLSEVQVMTSSPLTAEAPYGASVAPACEVGHCRCDFLVSVRLPRRETRPCPIGGRGWQRDNLVAQMLSNSAVLRPTAPRLESAATQHNDKRGASDYEKQDIEQVCATRWHR